MVEFYQALLISLSIELTKILLEKIRKNNR